MSDRQVRIYTQKIKIFYFTFRYWRGDSDRLIRSSRLARVNNFSDNASLYISFAASSSFSLKSFHRLFSAASTNVLCFMQGCGAAPLLIAPVPVFPFLSRLLLKKLQKFKNLLFKFFSLWKLKYNNLSSKKGDSGSVTEFLLTHSYSIAQPKLEK